MSLNNGRWLCVHVSAIHQLYVDNIASLSAISEWPMHDILNSSVTKSAFAPFDDSVEQYCYGHECECRYISFINI